MFSKRSYPKKQTCNWKLKVYVSMYDFFVDLRRKNVKHNISLRHLAMRKTLLWRPFREHHVAFFETLQSGVKKFLTYPFFHWKLTFYKWIRKKSSYDNPAGIYLLKVINGNTEAMCEICSKLKNIRTTSITSFWCLYL